MLCSILMLGVYRMTGITTFTPNLSQTVLGLGIACIVLAAALLALPVKTVKYILYLLALLTWLKYLVSEASYISNVLVGIDGNSFSTAFFLTAGAGLAAWALALAGAIAQKKEFGTARA